jgi:arylsulfatase
VISLDAVLHAVGLREPGDRIIDGVNQLDWLTGASEQSAREGYLYWMGPELYSARWRNFKMIIVGQRHMFDAPMRYARPRLVNLVTDPREREPIALPYLHTWASTHLRGLVRRFQLSVRQEPLIPLGAPLDHVPMTTS